MVSLFARRCSFIAAAAAASLVGSEETGGCCTDAEGDDKEAEESRDTGAVGDGSTCTGGEGEASPACWSSPVVVVRPGVTPATPAPGANDAGGVPGTGK